MRYSLLRILGLVAFCFHINARQMGLEMAFFNTPDGFPGIGQQEQIVLDAFRRDSWPTNHFLQELEISQVWLVLGIEDEI